MMNISKNRIVRRTGGIKIVIGFLILILALLAGLILNGSLNQEKQSNILTSAYESFNQADYEKAYQLFSEAGTTFSPTLSAYRMVRPGEYVNETDLGEILISTCLAAAYESFFMLEPSPDWIKRANEQLSAISDEQKKAELKQLVATAGEVSLLCQRFAGGEIEDALKDLKKVEQASLPGDQDFFIFEIRFLIACGKALEEPLIINKARELLFFATTDAGINNDKTKQLWGILTN